MPLNIPIINAWWHAGENGRIHYSIADTSGRVRRLFVDRGHLLYTVLEAHLRAAGYDPPQAA